MSVITGDEFPELSDVENEELQDDDFQNNHGVSIIGPVRMEAGDDFGSDWLPPVPDQGALPKCWAVSTSLLVAVKNAFHRYHNRHANEYLVPLFSPQCIINGLPRLAFPNEIKMQQNAGGSFYQSSTFMTLSFILKKGIARDVTYPLHGDFPFVGYCVADRDFERDAEIYRPFKIPVNISSGAIRRVLEKHGPLIGTIYCSLKILKYTKPPSIYREVTNRIIDKMESHCVVVVGVGRRNGETYLHIQNTAGNGWGQDGFGYVSLNLFHQLQGIKYASVPY